VEVVGPSRHIRLPNYESRHQETLNVLVHRHVVSHWHSGDGDVTTVRDGEDGERQEDFVNTDGVNHDGPRSLQSAPTSFAETALQVREDT
jgi:hypothetical protein